MCCVILILLALCALVLQGVEGVTRDERGNVIVPGLDPAKAGDKKVRLFATVCPDKIVGHSKWRMHLQSCVLLNDNIIASLQCLEAEKAVLADYADQGCRLITTNFAPFTTTEVYLYFSKHLLCYFRIMGRRSQITNQNAQRLMPLLLVSLHTLRSAPSQRGY